MDTFWRLPGVCFRLSNRKTMENCYLGLELRCPKCWHIWLKLKRYRGHVDPIAWPKDPLRVRGSLAASKGSVHLDAIVATVEGWDYICTNERVKVGGSLIISRKHHETRSQPRLGCTKTNCVKNMWIENWSHEWHEWPLIKRDSSHPENHWDPILSSPFCLGLLPNDNILAIKTCSDRHDGRPAPAWCPSCREG